MTNLNELIQEQQEQTSFLDVNHQLALASPINTKPKSKSRIWKNAKLDIQKQCHLCDSQLTIKYILPKKQYSKKNNWGYWTQKLSDQVKAIGRIRLSIILF